MAQTLGCIPDCVRERRSPFSPEVVVAEFADMLQRYRVVTVYGDRVAKKEMRYLHHRGPAVLLVLTLDALTDTDIFYVFATPQSQVSVSPLNVFSGDRQRVAVLNFFHGRVG
jgi:hypothetical protein